MTRVHSARRSWQSWLVSLLLVTCGGEVWAKTPPAWLTNLVAQSSSAQPASVPALVLLHEQKIVVEGWEDCSETTRYVVRLLGKNSQAHATFSLNYVNGTDEVTQLSACLIRPDGSIKDFDKSDWTDHSMLSETGLYSDFRFKSISAGVYAQPGDVFGCEVTIKRRLQFGETVWMPAGELPATLTRLSIKIPKDGEIELHWIGQPAELLRDDAVPNGIQQWGWRDLPYVPAEPHAPSLPSNYVFIRIKQKESAKPGRGLALSTWAGLAKLAAQYQDGSCDKSANLAAMAKKLTNGLATRAARLDAICRFVQKCPYASVDKNTGLGFGYRPRPASKVLDSRYGDCKDKVNLLRALLREIGVTAYPLAVSVQTPSGVDPGWASLLQFNHMIAAIQMPDPCTLPAAKEIPGFGQLLFFDPTSEQTPLGSLPWELQASLGLLCEIRSTGLIRLPQLTENSRWRQHEQSELVLSGSGLEGHTTLELYGEFASRFRQAARRLKESELREKWSAGFNSRARVTLTEFSFVDDWTDDRVTIQARFKAKEFGEKLPNQLWVIRLNFFAHVGIPELSEQGRRQPYIVSPVSGEESLLLKWPSDYKPETVPADIDIRGGFGVYHASFRVEDGAIRFIRIFSLKGATLTPAQYADFRQFLLAVAKADQSAVVLKRMEL